MSIAISDHDLKPLPLELVGRVLSLCLAVFGAWAWLLSAGFWTGAVSAQSAGFVLLAVLSVVLQIASNYAAAAARRASAYQLAASYRWAIGLMLAGGAYNAFSLHHAWEATGLVGPLLPLTAESVVANGPIAVLSIALAGFEPAIYWIDEALRAEASARQAQAESAAAERRAERLASQTARPEEMRAVFGRPTLVEIGRAAAGVALVAAGGAAVPGALAAPPVEQHEPRGRAGEPIARPVDPLEREKIEEEALALLMRGDFSQRAVAGKTGLSRHAVGLLARRVQIAETLAA